MFQPENEQSVKRRSICLYDGLTGVGELVDGSLELSLGLPIMQGKYQSWISHISDAEKDILLLEERFEFLLQNDESISDCSRSKFS